MGISFEKVSHKYPGAKKKEILVALENIDLSIDEHDEFVAVIGKTGSGKSTLIQHMNALLLPTSGKVTVFDNVLTNKKKKNPKLKPIRKRVGFVFQFPEYQLFEETVIKDIMFAPKNFKYKEEEALAKAKEACRLVGIEESLFEKSPFNLSGGQMRKVAIAGILAYDPDILVLDEPTRGLDPLTALEIMTLFKRINTEFHKTIILISHDMDLVYEYATRVIVMKDAIKVYDGDKTNLFRNEDYEAFHLDKPEILKLIDYLNAKFDYHIGYDTYTEQELLTKMEVLK